MNPAPVFDRVYAALKTMIREGAMRPGERLDPATLSDQLAASVTPVRDALHRLAGERLVNATAGDGFAVPTATEPDVRDLYQWNLELLKIALRASSAAQFPLAVPGAGELPAAALSDQLFAAIAARSCNRELQLAIHASSDRLHMLRRVEPKVLGDIAEELRAIGGADLRALRTLIGTYHRRRIAATPQLVRALYRGIA